MDPILSLLSSLNPITMLTAISTVDHLTNLLHIICPPGATVAWSLCVGTDLGDPSHIILQQQCFNFCHNLVSIFLCGTDPQFLSRSMNKYVNEPSLRWVTCSCIVILIATLVYFKAIPAAADPQEICMSMRINRFYGWVLKVSVIEKKLSVAASYICVPYRCYRVSRL